MPVPSPKSPLRSDYRFIQRLLQSVMGGKVEHVPAEYEKLTKAFVKAGGSWVKIFEGSPADISLLKKVIKLALAEGKLTKKYKWNELE